MSTPAFGLAAWLARTPLHPLNIQPQTWRERVVRRLLDDLALSARLWVRMVAFMRTRRYYLLYGEAVSPTAIAIQRARDNPQNCNFSGHFPKSLSQNENFSFAQAKPQNSQLYPHNRFNFTALDRKSVV